ncbi:VOC family protein [Flagellimonas meridianipacifica]|uniref:Catechol 2,3-dioxygenase-like lactoylglutathione lyase family enzyme n=1 Tax=Flagellimonas meridianipacifica TaxID=1080225 RepID=A0A2T0MCU3_9FLAO|nr:VOC family protein [Allomuricauda pacifica]PRX55304.1 catechol 2,3-dioxygenase-like lactoylglutathione lyase family enzyme [Allomuricauda pacifica]
MFKANFHHIRLNVTDIDKSISFYQKFFGATCLNYRGKAEALFTEKSFLLLNKVSEAPKSHLGTSLWHIGWSGVDGQSEFDWRVKEGIEVHTPINPLNDSHWMYFYGPNKEVVEVFTGNKNHRFEHIHLLASDVDQTMNWFKTNLGLSPESPSAQTWGNGLFKWNRLTVDNINIMVNGRPVQERTWYPSEGFSNTDGTSINHIAFSFPEIEPIYNHISGNNTEIVREIKTDPVYGLNSFLVRGPDGLLIEIVEEKPIPEGIWD